jgi:hypothetical protein
MQTNPQSGLDNSMVLPWNGIQETQIEQNSWNGNQSGGWSNTENNSGTVDVRSYQEMLFESVGRFMVCRFLMGNQNIITVSGILKNVGKDFFVLEDPCTKMATTCDLYSVKFISVLAEDVMTYIPSYCRRRLYENAPFFSSNM